ncbi:apolipoprotein N-acyltransferase [Singulisphaera rosea]
MAADDASPLRALPRQHPVVLALISGVLLWSTFPPADWGWLAWVALFPLFLLIKTPRSRISTYFGAWAGGMLFWLLSIEWIRLTDDDAWLAWIVMAAALSAWWPGFLLLARLAVLRLRLPVMVAAPTIWVGLEFLRAHILTGFPWYYLAHRQHNVLPLIQISDISGALGLSLLIAVVNAWLVELCTLPRFAPSPDGPRVVRSQVVRAAVVVTALTATVAYGVFRLSTAKFHDGPNVAMLQSNYEQSRKTAGDPDTLFLGYRTLITKALSGPFRPDMIVWPETSYPFHYYFVRESGVTNSMYEEQIKVFDPSRKNAGTYWANHLGEIENQIHSFVNAWKVPTLIGTITYHFQNSGFAKFNSAILFEPTVPSIQRYAKIHLVPFGEYVPLIETFPWLQVLTPYRDGHIPSLTFGTEATPFDLGRYRFATAICFEDTVPQAVRRFFKNPKDGRQPDFVVNISNDGWFHESSEHDMHLAISVFRSVENRVPLVRAANTGISALVDGNGNVVSQIRKNTADVLFATLPLDDRSTFYSAWGDWLGLTCLVCTIALLPLALLPLRTRTIAA